MIRQAYTLPAYVPGQVVLTSFVDSSNPAEVYAPGDEVQVVDAASGIELARWTVEGIVGGVITARIQQVFVGAKNDAAHSKT